MAYSYGLGDQNSYERRGVPSPYGGAETSLERPYLNYPPPHNASNPSLFKSQTNLVIDKAVNVDVQLYTSRTPSPTPSEQAMLNRKGVIDWQKIMKWRFWVRREWLWYYVIFGIILIFVILVSVYDRQIVKWLQPTAQNIKDLPAGWLIPVAIFFVISFPPLFGHEILAILCGVVWGLGVGFAITAAGTFAGELGNFYAFKYCCRARGEKLEKTDLQYACLARIVRDGGFRIALIARYSAIPGHFTTAVFSTCGMGVFVFALAAALSLPKQFVTVYIGVILKESGTGTESTRDKIISYSVFAVTTIITCVAMWYMYKKMDEVKQDVIYQRRKTRQAKLDRAQSLRGSSVFNPNESESDLPLNPGEDAAFQQWNAHGQAAGYAGDPRLSQALHAPIPQRAGINRIPTYRTEGGNGYSASGERYGSSSGGSASTSQTASAAPTPAQQRQESTDSVGWDATGGEGGEVYSLPTIQPHSPLSGGFAHVPVSANNPFNKTPLQQAQQSTSYSSPVPPPLAPPPSSNQWSANPYNPVVSPTQYSPYPMSVGHTSPQQNLPTPSMPYVAAVMGSPTLQQYPADTYANSQAPPHSPLQTPTQYGFATQPHPQTPTQTQAVASQPQSPVGPPAQTAFAHGPSSGPPNFSPFVSDHAVVGAHGQESSDASMYYTPAHSRAPTENQLEDRLPTPTHPPPYRF